MSKDIKRVARKPKQSGGGDNSGPLSSAPPAPVVSKDEFGLGGTSPEKTTLRQQSSTDTTLKSPASESSYEFRRADPALSKSAAPLFTFETSTKANDTCIAKSTFGPIPAYTTAPSKSTISLAAPKTLNATPTTGTSILPKQPALALSPVTATPTFLCRPFTAPAPASSKDPSIFSFEWPLVPATSAKSVIPVTCAAGTTTKDPFGTPATSETTSTKGAPTATLSTLLLPFNVATRSNTGTTTTAASSVSLTSPFKPAAPTLAFGSSTAAAELPTPALAKKDCSTKAPAAPASLSSSPTTSAPSLFPCALTPITFAATPTTHSTTATTAAAPFSSLPSSFVSLGPTTVPATSNPFSHGPTPPILTPSLFLFGSTSTASAAIPPTSSTTAASEVQTSPSGSPSSSVALGPITAPATTVSAAPNAFTFSTVLNDMPQAVNPVSTQFNVALVTLAVSAFSQNQTMAHTDFRIDNILPTTRYTELPEQAQHELDQLNQYIQSESQRYEYLLKCASTRQQESMDQVKHSQQVMSYKLDSLANTLQIQVNAMEELFESLKNQIQRFIDGKAVVDIYKHQGTRLSHQGYSYTDDYFVQLSTQLMTRLEEYKKCIQDIEAKLNSWTQNKVQSPQDIARVMASLNQACLALADKVAALHEQLDMEQDLYMRHQLQSVTL